MIYFYFILIVFGNVGFGLRCKRAFPENCILNSTCSYQEVQCKENNTSKLRGGVYCTTIIQRTNETVIGMMDCLYDQEATKPCFNHTECILKYTDKTRTHAHCCCNRDLCNHDYIFKNESDIEPNTIEGPVKHCKTFACFSNYIVLPISIVLLIILLLSIVCYVKRRKLFQAMSYFCKFCDKESFPKSHSNTNETEPFLNKIPINEKPINVNDLKIENVLKRGRFTSIHQGKLDDKPVAIKIYDTRANNDQSQLSFRSEKEIYQLSNMEHENILKFYGFCVSNEANYLITELSQFGSLGDVLRSRLLKDKRELVSICKQIANGLEFLHRDFRKDGFRGSIAHRDLKPENILYLNETRIVICDFAMSILLDDSRTTINEQQQIGTIRYMSPEILAGLIGCETNALLKCDVYSLAITYWEILSRYPFTDENQKFEFAFERQLIEHKFNSSPSIKEMLQIINLASPFNRPLIKQIWKDFNDKIINEVLLTMGQCWDQNPDGRITSALVAKRMQQLEILI